MSSTSPLDDLFQSTLPVRGGTTLVRIFLQILQFQSTLPVRGGTGMLVDSNIFGDFNPPSPCGEGLYFHNLSISSAVFQSTLPVRGGTQLQHGRIRHVSISIHPPRAGRDTVASGLLPASCHFNPPSPCGEGRPRKEQQTQRLISIHPPRAGRDMTASFGPSTKQRFQSTLPVRGGTFWFFALLIFCANFNPPSPCGEGPKSPRVRPSTSDFNPPSPCGEGHHSASVEGRKRYFNPPSPCGEGLRQMP